MEEHGLVAALDADVELVGIVADLFRNDRVAAVRRHEIENLVFGVRRLVLEIHTREEMREHAARKHRDAEMRRLQLAIGPRHAAGLHGGELIGAFGKRLATAEALEAGIRLAGAERRMLERALRIGL